MWKLLTCCLSTNRHIQEELGRWCGKTGLGQVYYRAKTCCTASPSNTKGSEVIDQLKTQNKTLFVYLSKMPAENQVSMNKEQNCCFVIFMCFSRHRLLLNGGWFPIITLSVGDWLHTCILLCNFQISQESISI